ncbi:WAT1-related protein [Citrus sinensis]|nr:WAT1-related protein [Citrus sinensis]
MWYCLISQTELLLAGKKHYPGQLIDSERVNLGTTEGQAKVGGTVICVSGAILMVLFHGPALFGGSNQDFVTQTEISERGQLAPAGWLVSSFLELGLDHWMIGTASAWLVFWLSRTIRLFGKAYTLMVEDEVSAHNSCLSYTFRGLISCGKHIRAQVLKEYPASLSVTAYSYFFGAIFIVITTFFMANESTDWSLTESELFAVIYADRRMSNCRWTFIWSLGHPRSRDRKATPDIVAHVTQATEPFIRKHPSLKSHNCTCFLKRTGFLSKV